MRWTTWGVLLILSGLAVGPAQANDGYGYGYHHYGYPPTPMNWWAECPPYYMGNGIYGNQCDGYRDCGDDDCWVERFYRKVVQLERRKNSWLKKAFLGIDDGGCYPGGGGCYYTTDYGPYPPYAPPYSFGSYQGYGY